MNRAGYSDEYDGWSSICWRGAVASAIRGKRGQAFLREMLAALDALPVKELVVENLQLGDGRVCAIGAVGVARGIKMDDLDPENYEAIARRFGIAEALVREIEWENDEAHPYHITARDRWALVRKWVSEQIKQEIAPCV